jgi:hypothetical protein
MPGTCNHMPYSPSLHHAPLLSFWKGTPSKNFAFRCLVTQVGQGLEESQTSFPEHGKSSTCPQRTLQGNISRSSQRRKSYANGTSRYRTPPTPMASTKMCGQLGEHRPGSCQVPSQRAPLIASRPSMAASSAPRNTQAHPTPILLHARHQRT